jgi:hypothetical protein
MNKNYFEHNDKAASADAEFKHVMAIALDPRTDYHRGVIRCITSREGDVQVKGYVDRSELHLTQGDSLEKFTIGKRLDIKNELEIINTINESKLDFIGLEDPDIWIDEKADLMHLYFTIPLISKEKSRNKIHLGHAMGKDLNSLEMTPPVLIADVQGGAKEVSIAPLNTKGFRYNLVESADRIDGTKYSVVRLAVAHDMGKDWKFGDIVFHPAQHNISWIAGHASPGPLFSENFIHVGEGKRLGIINGREANQDAADGTTKYGMFSVGLFIYDYEHGKIDWVSPEPFIRDSEAVTITFASQFVETEKGKGILYAHVDDSFVRAYDLDAEKIKELLPKK